MEDKKVISVINGTMTLSVNFIRYLCVVWLRCIYILPHCLKEVFLMLLKTKLSEKSVTSIEMQAKHVEN